MTVEYFCERCGKKVSREILRRGNQPPRVCEACQKERKREYMRRYDELRKDRRAAYRKEYKWRCALAKPPKFDGWGTVAKRPKMIVRRCRRCGREFAQRGDIPVGSADHNYTLHSWCSDCRAVMRKRARAASQRWAGVPGHETLEVQA